MSNTLTSKVSGRMSSRGWAIALGIGAIVLAAILLVVYLDRYRARVGGENAPTPVLVAKQLIPAGNAGDARREPADVRADDAPAQGGRGRGDRRSAVPERARGLGRHLPRPAVHRDRLRRRSDTASVDSQITGEQRAISVSMDNVRGSLSQLQAGDSVDIYIGVAGAVKLFRPNVKVLAIPCAAGPERRRQPDPPDHDEGRGGLRVRGGQHAALVRPPAGRRRQADEADHRDRSVGAEVERIH